jgi:hypothetical protein
LRLFAPLRRAHGVGQRRVVTVLRQRRAEVDPVAVEVDIVFRHAPVPGETKGVDGVDHQHGGASRYARNLAAPQPIHLRARTAISFDAMGAGNENQHALGVLRAPPGEVGREILPVRSAFRVCDPFERPAGIPGGVEKTGARLVIGGAEAFGGIQVHWESPDVRRGECS